MNFNAVSVSPRRISLILKITLLLIFYSFALINFISLTQRRIELKPLIESESRNRSARRLRIDFSESLNKTGRQFWEGIKPGFDCPKKLLLKIGGKYDGGKWTCGISNLGKVTPTSFTIQQAQAPCLVYSFGVNKDSAFETEVLATTYCDVFAFDPSDDKIGYPLHPSNPRVHFKKLGISGKDTGNMRTLKTLMQENGHKWIDILKMDVESGEYDCLGRILNDFNSTDNNSSEKRNNLPFGQLLVEMHVDQWAASVTLMDKIPGQIVTNLFTRLEKRGLRMFYKEINPFGGGNYCSEFSFINTNKLSIQRFLGNE